MLVRSPICALTWQDVHGVFSSSRGLFENLADSVWTVAATTSVGFARRPPFSWLSGVSETNPARSILWRGVAHLGPRSVHLAPKDSRRSPRMVRGCRDRRPPSSVARIIQLMTRHADETWAVDLPFGWSDGIVHLMSERHDGPLPSALIPATESWETWRTRPDQPAAHGSVPHRQRAHQDAATPGVIPTAAAMSSLIEAQLAPARVAVDRVRRYWALLRDLPRAALAAWTHRGAGNEPLASASCRLRRKVCASGAVREPTPALGERHQGVRTRRVALPPARSPRPLRALSRFH